MASDDAHSAAYLTSSEPSPQPSSDRQPLSQGSPSNGQTSSPDPLETKQASSQAPLLTAPDAARGHSIEPPLPQVTAAGVASGDTGSGLLVASPKHSSADPHKEEEAGLLPPAAGTGISDQSCAVSQSCELQAGSPEGTIRLGFGLATGVALQAPVAQTDTRLDRSPSRMEYDPRRYRSQSSLEELLGPRLLSAQTQLLCHSPRQAAISKLRSLSVKQSLSSKPAAGEKVGSSHPAVSAQHAQHADSFEVVSEARAVSTDLIAGLKKTSRTAGQQQPLQQTSVSRHSDRHRQVASSHTAQTDTEQASMPQSSAHLAASIERSNAAVLLSPHRSCSVARLRSQSFAKHLHDHRQPTSRSLAPAVPAAAAANGGAAAAAGGAAGAAAAAGGAAGAAAADVQRQQGSTDTQTEARPAASCQSQAGLQTEAAQTALTQHVASHHRQASLAVRQDVSSMQMATALPSADSAPPSGEDDRQAEEDDRQAEEDDRQAEEDERQALDEPLDAADIALMLVSGQDRAASEPEASQSGVGPMTHSADSPLHSEGTLVSGLNHSPVLDRAHSKSEGCSPVSISSTTASGSSDRNLQHSQRQQVSGPATSTSTANSVNSTHSQRQHASGPATSASSAMSVCATDLSSAAQHDSGDGTVAVCISSTGAGATVSLRVEPGTDAHVSTSPSGTVSTADGVCHLSAEAVRLDLGAGSDGSAASTADHSKQPPTALCHVGCESVSPGRGQSACGSLGSQAHAQQSREAEKIVGTLPNAGPIDSTDQDGEGSIVPRYDQKAVPAGPERGADHGQQPVGNSPGRRSSPGQGLFGRLEGGIRSLLGRAPKQV